MAVSPAEHGELGRHLELSIVMPCLNEAATVAACVQKAISFLLENDIDGEVIVADNGSTDASPALAEAAGARVVDVPERGYGSALMGGIDAARGRFIIIGDADESYDFSDLMPFLAKLRAGADLVMGNRFRGGIAAGAMPALHRYFGNPVLSFIGRLFFRSNIGDFHCGLRGFAADSILRLGLQTAGMEFASEMIVKATLANQRIEEVPTTLSPDGRGRAPHLRSWRDGWRHLRFLLLFSPRWLFFYPGLALLILGLGAGAAIIPGPLVFGSLKLDVNTLLAASAAVVIGVQAVLFAVFTSVYASNEGFLPTNSYVMKLLRFFNLERGLVAGTALGLAGIMGSIVSISRWSGAAVGHLPYDTVLRVVIPSATALITSWQLLLGSFFLSILGIRRSGQGQSPLNQTAHEARHHFDDAPMPIARSGRY